MRARARAELLPENLRSNLRALSHHAKVRVLLPVKANAYGHGVHGVVDATRHLPELWGYAVATPWEAAELAELRPNKPILVLTPAAPDELSELAALGARVTVSSREEAELLPDGMRAHLKIDTGMNRLGVRPEGAPDLAHRLHSRGQLEGVMTHFASADGPDLSAARRQLEVFRDTLARLPKVLAHAANSGGLLSFGPSAAFDLVRPGIAAYGYPPSHLAPVLPLSPALRVTARVNFVHAVRAGENVSYDGLWTAPRDTVVAVIGMGYADGLPRNATGKAQVLVRGERRPVLGRICMDQCMVDVTGLDVRVGEQVEVFGNAGVSVQDWAEWGGTVTYEVLTGLGRRVERTVAAKVESGAS